MIDDEPAPVKITYRYDFVQGGAEGAGVKLRGV